MPGTNDNEDAVPPSFTLKNAGGNFAGRSSSVFGCLEELERKHLTNEKNRTDTEEYANLNPVAVDDFVVNSLSIGGHSSRSIAKKRGGQSEDRRDRSRSSLAQDRKEGSSSGGADRFKVPRGKAPKSSQVHNFWEQKRMHDHGSHLQGWTYYNLEGVGRSDMSEKSNTQAALVFLDERRQLREQQQQEEAKFDAGSGACSKGLFSFTKRSKKTAAEGEKSENTTQTSSSLEGTDSTRETDFVTEVVETIDKNDDDTVNVIEENSTTCTSQMSSEDQLTPVYSASQSFKSRKRIARCIRFLEKDSGDN